MAFIQQQRRRATIQRSTSSNEVLYSDQFTLTTPSDSETDWHVISSASNHSSPILFPSESEESSSFRPSDTEESDFQPSEDDTTFLPSHDGTGTFIVEDSEFFSSDQATTTSSEEEEEDEDEVDFKSALQNLTSDNSILDMILLQQPSFATKTPLTDIMTTKFKPTTAGLNSQELIHGVSADEDDKVMNNTLISDGGTPHIKFTSKLQKDLDRIPIHHPGIPGSSTSAALLSLVWDSLKRLTNHLIENDTNTVETISSLMSEAVIEGCIPFGSHLHMEVENHHHYHHSLLEVE